MFKIKNGWTKAKMKKRIKERNTNRRCYGDNEGVCLYENGKNHCAVGIFIPAKHDGLQTSGTSEHLFNEFPELLKKMPLSATGMRQLQIKHDFYSKDTDLSLHKTLFKWIDENVKE